MVSAKLMEAFLNSLKNPFLFADRDHIIRYVNTAAIQHYEEGDQLLGRSLLDCHNEESQKTMIDTLRAMDAGEDERLITDNEKHRIYMRAVRDVVPGTRTSSPTEA